MWRHRYSKIQTDLFALTNDIPNIFFLAGCFIIDIWSLVCIAFQRPIVTENKNHILINCALFWGLNHFNIWFTCKILSTGRPDQSLSHPCLVSGPADSPWSVPISVNESLIQDFSYLVPLLMIFDWRTSTEHCDEHWPASAGTAAVAATNSFISLLVRSEKLPTGQFHQEPLIQIRNWSLTFFIE